MKKQMIPPDDQIDLAAIARTLVEKKYFLLKFSVGFFVLGFVVAVTSVVEFRSSCKLLPESQESAIPDLGGLGGLAGLAGVDLSAIGSSNALTPELYPEIVNSTPFREELWRSKIYFEEIDTLVSSDFYFRNLYEPSFFTLIGENLLSIPVLLKNLVQNGDRNGTREYGLLRYSKEEWELIEDFSDRLSVEIDVKSDIVTVATEMPDPVAAAQLTDQLVKRLTEKITKYKIEKVEIGLEFVKERLVEAEERYNDAQRLVAEFTDRNRNISSSSLQVEFERLQNELNLTFEVYKGLATQYEQARIKVKEQTPVFTILEPVRIPEEKSSPRRLLIIVGFTLSGIFLGVFMVLIKAPNRFYSVIKSEDLGE